MPGRRRPPSSCRSGGPPPAASGSTRGSRPACRRWAGRGPPSPCRSWSRPPGTSGAGRWSSRPRRSPAGPVAPVVAVVVAARPALRLARRAATGAALGLAEPALLVEGLLPGREGERLAAIAAGDGAVAHSAETSPRRGRPRRQTKIGRSQTVSAERERGFAGGRVRRARASRSFDCVQSTTPGRGAWGAGRASRVVRWPPAQSTRAGTARVAGTTVLLPMPTRRGPPPAKPDSPLVGVDRARPRPRGFRAASAPRGSPAVGRTAHGRAARAVGLGGPSCRGIPEQCPLADTRRRYAAIARFCQRRPLPARDE